MTTFLEYATKEMARREEQGIRGVDREWSRFRCHIATAPFAEMQLEEIRPRHIREWLRLLAQKKCASGDVTKHLSRPSRHRAKTLVSAIFLAAVDEELIEQSPCSGVKDKKTVDESDTTEKASYLTHEEQKLIAECEAIPVHDRLAIMFSIYTGIRQGEFRHLELGDVHLDDESPHIVVRYASRSKRTKERLPPKSGKVRKVPLIAQAEAVLREWLVILPTFAPDNPHNLVWPTASGTHRQQGKPLGRSDTVRRHYVAAGIKLRPHLHWHALRHTFGSSLIAGWWGRTWDLPEVQVVMGHSSVTITERYARLGEDSIAKAAKETNVEPPIQVPTLGLVGSMRSAVSKVFEAIRSAS